MVDWSTSRRGGPRGGTGIASPATPRRTSDRNLFPTSRARHFGRSTTVANEIRGRGPGAEGATGPNLSRPRRWTLARIGYLLAPFFSAWFVLAYVLASPVGVYVPAIPLLGILWAVSVFLLAFGLFRVHPRWTRWYRTSLLVGSVAGLVVAGTLGAAALAQGCPVLTPNTQAAPQGWVKLPNAAWSVDDRAVALFLGSVACPYCSASSWAILAALSKVGNVSGTTLGHSTTSDVYPATPEVVLADAQLSSPWVDTTTCANPRTPTPSRHPPRARVPSKPT